MKCFLPAWLFAWVAVIFVPSGLIALFSLPGADVSGAEGIVAVAREIFEVADEMAPLAKLLLGVLLMLALSGVQYVAKPLPAFALAILAAIAAMAATLSLIPVDYSRGFGIGLTGERFDARLLPAYLVGTIFAGLVFAASCRRRQKAGLTHSSSSMSQ